jgi:hypothetical protein
MHSIFYAAIGMENSGANEACNLKFQNIIQIYTCLSNGYDPKVEKSQKHFIVDWRKFVTQNPYGVI